ncbi:MAG: hypothetical protein M0Z31_05105 [Clostridia bacterium]|nr:hypothetical protein [Clostridia bacterium]
MKYQNGNNYIIIDNDGWVDINSGLGYSGTSKIGNVDANQYLEGYRWILVGKHTSVEHVTIHHNHEVWDKTMPWLN